ncbi:MAG: hypothetical protein PHW95_02905 [Patescibacteria group bacterium]|nr:hypothetical protein [Patescibacteria group bacterium]
MNINWKRIALLVGFVVAVLLIGYLLYFLFLKPTIPTANQNINALTGEGGLPVTGTNVNIPIANDINGALPGSSTTTDTNLNPTIDLPLTTGQTTVSVIANGGLTKTIALTTGQASSISITADGTSAAYYDKTSGIFYEIGSNGKVIPLSDKVFYSVQNVTWSPDKKQAVLEYPDGANILYNFDTGRQVTLPEHWKNFSFSPTGDQIVFKSMGTDPENRWLAISNADGSQAKKIEPLGDQDATVYSSWSPNNQIIATFTEDLDFDRQNLYFVGINGENFKSAIIEGRGFQSQWSSSGDKLLYSVYSSNTDYKPTLWIVDAQGDNIGQNRKSINLETWADKCTFQDNSTVYCAVPRTLQTGAGIFNNDLDTSPTDIYKVDLTNGIKTKVAVPQGDINIDKLMVTKDGGSLYFTSKTNGRLYTISLK